tara:strand:- start:119 stop:532 length:414 start_codon:yes stop_codon:yes gene_type:complete
MFDNFDEFESLFEKYFGKSKRSEIDSEELDNFAEMIEKLNEITDSFNLTDSGFDPDEDELGEPEDIIFFEENGFSFQKTTWNAEGGKIVKVEMISSPIDRPKSVNYEKKLKLAIEAENYEEAAKLRDKISSDKNKNL